MWLLTAKGYSKVERGRFWAILVLFIASALFWSAFEQAGSTLNLFAERNTNLHAWDSPLVGPVSRQLFPVAQFGLHHRAGTVFDGCGSRSAATNRPAPPSSPWAWSSWAWASPILIPVAGGTAVSPWWLTADLPPAHHRRTLPESGRPERHDQTRAGAHRRPDDGRLVSVRCRSAIIIGGRLASVYETFPLPRSLRRGRRFLHRCGPRCWSS